MNLKVAFNLLQIRCFCYCSENEIVNEFEEKLRKIHKV